ncbi:IucA/IucC family protein [Williamsia sp. SKLECPSW1]
MTGSAPTLRPHVSAVDHHSTYGRRLARKMLAEFCHERLVHPIRVSGESAGATYLVLSDDRRVEYLFRAEVLPLEHWVIDERSMQRVVDGTRRHVDPVQLILDVHETIGLPGDAVPPYLEELVSTLGVGADRPERRWLTAAELAVADFQTVESAMTEGHPCIVANAGRIGFSTDDLARYAPDRGPTCHLTWVAARRDRCEVATLPEVDLDRLVAGELGEETVGRFTDILLRAGLDPSDYLFLPVHPWQWTEKISRVLAPDLADAGLVLLGEAPDRHRPQQSIRTMFNATRPHRPYVKLALSITNMGFTRGMSADYMRTTPLINEWVRGRVDDDPYLRSIGFRLLYEVAAAGYRSPVFDGITEVGSEYRKLLAALWRDSPTALIGDGEQLATMAALLHVDHRGTPLVAAYVDRSGLSADEWVRRYLRVYLHPITYLLHRHDLKFSPHGENLILVLDRGVPVRAILKDIGEEVTVVGDAAGLPDSCARAAVPTTDEIAALGVLSDVMDDFLRPLSGVLHESGLVEGERFWDLVAESVREFASEHAELAEPLRRRDLFVPEFGAIHLNRLQMGNARRMVDLGDSYAALLDGDHRLANPLADPRRAS